MAIFPYFIGILKFLVAFPFGFWVVLVRGGFWSYMIGGLGIGVGFGSYGTEGENHLDSIFQLSVSLYVIIWRSPPKGHGGVFCATARTF
jgi:hypothetical protein